jgi:hypothetical protein
MKTHWRTFAAKSGKIIDERRIFFRTGGTKIGPRRVGSAIAERRIQLRETEAWKIGVCASALLPERSAAKSKDP